jgi:hydrogenase maturation protease
LGSPFGDDRVGWEVVARLRESLPEGTRIDTTSDPLVVLEPLPGAERLIIIDACRGAGEVGSIYRFEWPDPRLAASGTVSSHGVQLTAALELAAALGRLPRRVTVLAIEAGADGPEAGLSEAVEAALPEVVSRVLAEVGGFDE